MKVHAPKGVRKTTEKITLSTHHPVSGRTLHAVTISVSEGMEAIDYLRQHNGTAPPFVHEFINGMEIALNLQWLE